MGQGNASITSVKGVGEKTARLFHKLDVYSVNDLIEYYPRDYKSYSEPVSINSLKAGQTFAVRGQITKSPMSTNRGNKKIITCTVSDGSGELSLTWYNALFLKNILKKGGRFVFYGKVKRFGNSLRMEHPEYFTVDAYRAKLNSLTPVYVKTAGITDNMIIKLLHQCFGDGIEKREYLMKDMLNSLDFMSLDEAIRQIHFPDNFEKLKRARKRIAFDELFFFILQIKNLKRLTENEANNYPIHDSSIVKSFLASLPYELTKAQQSALKDIINDLSRDSQMHRIIQGDVGSGKTILAVTAMLLMKSNGYQSAMMAPTEVLAQQHFESINEYFNKLDMEIHVELLTGSTSRKEKERIYSGLENGQVDIVVGTQALIQDKVNYKNLSLVITDEQHRFGVNQRNIFAKKGTAPHVLVMSATPIPRTLGLILYGDMDISIINELPANRLAIKNCVVGVEKRASSYAFMKKELQKGHQVYVICPLVEESEDLDVCDVISYSEIVQNALGSEYKCAYLHGKMKNEEKRQIMEEFAGNRIQVLVSTTVIEVGINVPNATVIMIENADRFGLATLHQLRGRVGRGKDQSYCIMINSSETDKSAERLDILNKSNDGFFIANEDLKQRGVGDLLGITQSGEMNFKMADIYEDSDLVKLAARIADDILPQLEADLENQSDFIKFIDKKLRLKDGLSKIDAI